MIQCQNCQNLFKPARSWQHFCCQKCRSQFHVQLAKTLKEAYLKAQEN